MKIRDVRCAGLRGATPEGGWRRAAEGRMPTLSGSVLGFTPDGEEIWDRPAVRPG
jgi:hypothetical protein